MTTGDSVDQVTKKQAKKKKKKNYSLVTLHAKHTCLLNSCDCNFFLLFLTSIA